MFFLLFVSMFSWSGNLSQDPVYQGVQDVYDAVLGQDGLLDYARLQKDPALLAKLQAYQAVMARLDPKGLSKNEMLAAYANAYNVFTMLGIVAHWPVKSVTEIQPDFGFFSQAAWLVGGEKISLNTLEQRFLRPIDVRIHFIINCGSISCPPLYPKVLTAENIEGAMAASSKSFVANPQQNYISDGGKTWHLSKIFEWYQSDFGSQSDVIQFIRAQKTDWQIPNTIKFLEYDWAVNSK